MVATATLVSRLLPENRFTRSFRLAETHPFFLAHRGSTRARRIAVASDRTRASRRFASAVSIPRADRVAHAPREWPTRPGPPSLGGVSHSEINYTRENTLCYCIACARRIRGSLASRRFDTWRAARDPDNPLCASLTADKSRATRERPGVD